MLLYLVRHAAAADRDVLRWPNDRDRPLTSRGERQFKQVAAALPRVAPDVEVVLSSRLVRAWQTAEISRKRGGWPPPQACAALEPAGTSAEVAEALNAYASAAGIGLVGHEPNLSLLASYLLLHNEMLTPFEFMKGGMACIELAQGPRAGAGRLRWFLPPKLARALA